MFSGSRKRKMLKKEIERCKEDYKKKYSQKQGINYESDWKFKPGHCVKKIN